MSRWIAVGLVAAGACGGCNAILGIGDTRLADPDAGPDENGDADTAVVCDDGFAGPDCDECVIYVDGEGGDDGQTGWSWSEAKGTVQAGIKGAEARIVGSVEVCSVWVRAGIYRPGTERTDAFELASGVAVYGGFAGGETRREDRDFEANETILSGDLAENDDPEDSATRDENAYHVLIGADDAVLDGFTVTAGNADGEEPENRGGGMFNNGVSPSIENVIFSRNRGKDGGGMYNKDASPMLENVTFSDHFQCFSGCGMYNENASPILANVTFSNNTLAEFGTAMANWE